MLISAGDASLAFTGDPIDSLGIEELINKSSLQTNTDNMKSS